MFKLEHHQKIQHILLCLNPAFFYAVHAYFEWMAIPCLSFADSCVEKMLANADRWNDSSVESRDLIDLAILRLESSFSAKTYAKAEAAYPVLVPLKKAIENFQQKSDYRKKCFRSLQLRDWPALIDGVDLLAQDLSLPLTLRADDELHLDEYGLPLIT